MHRLLCLIALALAACTTPPPAASTPAPAAPAAPKGLSAAAGAAPTAVAASRVAKVVFVGKKEACECTRKAIDASRKALTTALGARGITVEEIQSDIDGSKVEFYKVLKPHLTLPALYFLDAKDGIVELLQGELTEAQIQAVL